MTNPYTHVEPGPPEEAIGQAIQRITAARLGRGFVPLALLAVVGVLELAFLSLTAAGGWILMLGAAATAGTMLTYALRNVQLAFGRPHRTWMSAAMAGSLVPPAFTLYVLGWRGLRLVAVGDGLSPRMAGVVLAVLGWWALTSWMKVVEVQRLARAMSLDGDTNPGDFR